MPNVLKVMRGWTQRRKSPNLVLVLRGPVQPGCPKKAVNHTLRGPHKAAVNHTLRGPHTAQVVGGEAEAGAEALRRIGRGPVYPDRPGKAASPQATQVVGGEVAAVAVSRLTRQRKKSRCLSRPWSMNPPE